MHPKGGMQLALAMSTQYSVRQMYDILEMLDVYDDMEQQAISKAKNNTAT